MHSQNFKDIPIKPDSIIQKVAPGPPREMATATPPIFPKPTVPDKAVAKALKCETSPFDSFFENFPETNSKACLKPLKLMNLK